MATSVCSVPQWHCPGAQVTPQPCQPSPPLFRALPAYLVQSPSRFPVYFIFMPPGAPAPPMSMVMVPV